MKITDEAKAIITQLLGSNNNDCLKVMTQKSSCGTSVYFVLAKLKVDDTPVSVSGIPVLMDIETQVRAETVTITTKNGRLNIQDDI